MTKQAKRLVVPAVAGVLLLAPNALAGAGQANGAQRACPQKAGTSCQDVGTRSGGKATKPLRSAIVTNGTDSRGQQVWRAGNHTMY